MDIMDLIDPKRVNCHTEAGSKKRVLELMSELLARDNADVTTAEVFSSLFERERLGSTGLGHGIAIPHGRVQHGTRPVVAFARMVKGVDFDAPDRRPVDLVFGLIVPEDADQTHLQILASLAQLLADDRICNELRACASSGDVLTILSRQPPKAANQ